MVLSADRTTIVLVDDNDLLRAGLQEILETYSDLVVVGGAADSATATALVADKRPDVVVLDVEIPGDDVTTTVRRMRAVSPATQVVILTMYAGEELVRRLIAEGVRACLPKSTGHAELVSAIYRARDTAHAGDRTSDRDGNDSASEPEVLEDEIYQSVVGTPFSAGIRP